MALPFTSLLVVLLLTVFSSLCFGRCHRDDEAGLLGFKSGITEDPSGMLSSWIPGTDCCKWSSVKCSNTNRDRVTHLELFATGMPTSYLTGRISPSVLKLRQLTHLSLVSLGNLTGPLPIGLFDLPMLEEVSIENMKLSGQLSFGNNPKSTRLTFLSLYGHQFTGPIPNSISQFTRLNWLSLHSNKLSGSIPLGIQYLKNLTYLALSNNQLSGAIPNIFKSLPLVDFYLNNNTLSGEIPPSFSFLAPELQLFVADHNALTGKIPNYFMNFNKLEILGLSYNHLSGQIPTTKFKFGPESFEGNDGLCGSPLPPCRN